MNKCNGTERKKRWFVCSDPFFSISFHFIRFHSIFYLEKRNATERNGGREGGRESKKLFLYYLEKRSGMERNGTETGREGRSRIRQPNIAKYIPWTFLPSLFRSVPCELVQNQATELWKIHSLDLSSISGPLRSVLR